MRQGQLTLAATEVHDLTTDWLTPIVAFDNSIVPCHGLLFAEAKACRGQLKSGTTTSMPTPGPG